MFVSCAFHHLEDGDCVFCFATSPNKGKTATAIGREGGFHDVLLFDFSKALANVVLYFDVELWPLPELFGGKRLLFLFFVGRAALHHAANNGHLKAVKALIDAGADIAARDGEGRAALRF